MKQQHYKNHRRLVPPIHVFTIITTILIFLASLRLIFVSPDDRYLASLLALVSVILFMQYFHGRSFAMRAQDRAIRAEERLRYHLLTGRDMDPRLTTSQIIALRFAGDEEFPGLAQRAAEQGLSGDAIKQEIKKWRADWHRV